MEMLRCQSKIGSPLKTKTAPEEPEPFRGYAPWERALIFYPLPGRCESFAPMMRSLSTATAVAELRHAAAMSTANCPEFPDRWHFFTGLASDKCSDADSMSEADLLCFTLWELDPDGVSAAFCPRPPVSDTDRSKPATPASGGPATGPRRFAICPGRTGSGPVCGRHGGWLLQRQTPSPRACTRSAGAGGTCPACHAASPLGSGSAIPAASKVLPARRATGGGDHRAGAASPAAQSCPGGADVIPVDVLGGILRKSLVFSVRVSGRSALGVWKNRRVYRPISWPEMTFRSIR